MTRQVYGREHAREISAYLMQICIAYLCFIVIFAGFYCIIGFLIPDADLIYMGEKVIGQKKNFWDIFDNLLYFSSMTLFTVGYGDIQPVGFARVIAVVEAFLGYLLPVLVVANGVMRFTRKRRKK